MITLVIAIAIIQLAPTVSHGTLTRTTGGHLTRSHFGHSSEKEPEVQSGEADSRLKISTHLDSQGSGDPVPGGLSSMSVATPCPLLPL